MKKEEPNHILFMGTYPPRECGIATFTRDLTEAISKRIPHLVKTKIAALNNNGVNIYNYPKNVFYQISDIEIEDYINLAKKINSSNINLVCIQHEFGIFGGEHGDFLLPFLEIVKKPVVITFHSVLPSPDDKLRKVVKSISEKVNEIIVMTQKAVKILRNEYHIKTRIHVIPHGVPVTTFETQKRMKKTLGFENNIILSSFGMIGPGKGFEYVIEALPNIIKLYPDLLYLIVGETHPMVRKKEGERYRNCLTKKIEGLGLEKHVKFYNKYLTLDEIVSYLKATDIYISPSQNPKQITSGTLAYAMGCGRATISTAFLHAKDVITKDVGLLVGFEKPKAFEKAITCLLKNRSLRKKMEKNVYYKTRNSTWPNVAMHYSDVFKNYLELGKYEPESLPPIDTSHLVRLTDNFGVVQFAIQSKPDLQSGYTLDDNSRAIFVCVKHYEKFKEFKQLSLIKTYLDYIKYVQSSNGKLYNFVDSSKKVDEKWCEDAHGRAIWALGYLISSHHMPEDFKKEAEEIFLKAVDASYNIKSLRAVSFVIQGLYFYNQTSNSYNINKKISNFSDILLSSYKENSSKDWRWFEPFLIYANSKMPEALLYSYLATGQNTHLQVALESLDFLIENLFQDDIFMPIGQRGWYKKGGERAYFDQQPIEAGYTVQTLALAYKITGDVNYKKRALQSFNWFMGKNTLNQVVYNEATGGCYDGFNENAINLNQGAESTVSFLLARLGLMEI